MYVRTIRSVVVGVLKKVIARAFSVYRIARPECRVRPDHYRLRRSSGCSPLGGPNPLRLDSRSPTGVVVARWPY